ncbi:unnamed protein product [Peronospora belbahrii]|uniref:Origin recognition complex subunit 4 C-terminal domain-containing protein n=1 Tax=Peronospora belbahrii TaxID=622444 RepID=A0ABN8CNT1_9STRA|nr:unnamed protein product [Peronospora belbahrii]
MPSEEEIRSVRCALRLRLTNKDVQVTQLERLFERTVQFGENQSGFLLGSVGSYRHSIVACAMSNLRATYGDFTVVYLNGVILQNELEAFKELTAQLTRATAVKHPYCFVDRRCLTGIYAFEHFVQEKSNNKQMLLYNLLDWLQATDIKMGVLGITDNYNVVDNLEKRVRSRFSNFQIVVERPSFAKIRQYLVDLLSVDKIPWDFYSDLRQPSAEYTAAFSTSVNELFMEQSKFLASLEFDYDIGKSQDYFVRLTAAAVYYISVDESLLTAQHFRLARHLLEQDHQLAVLETVTEHGIALLIGMGHLEKGGQRVFTLEMVYSRWENFLRQHDMLGRLPTRSEAHKALENLLQLKLVMGAGDAFKIGRSGKGLMKQDHSGSLQPEFRAVHLNFAPQTLAGVIRNGSIKCSTLLKEWAVSGS